MRINFKTKLLICMLIPVVILLSMTVTPLLTLYNGTEIYIKANAYTSSDSFRGKNLSIEYSINHLDKSKFTPDLLNKEYKNYNAINGYAVLKKNGEFYEVDYITLKKPTSNLYLKCFFSLYHEEDPNDKIDSRVYVNYNLDKYFSSEKEGLTPNQQPKYENEINWNYLAKIKIYKGYALLEDVILKK
jgi:hypothetical protein